MEKEKDNDTSSAAAKSKSRAPRSRTAVFVVLGLIAMIVYAGSVALISLTLVPAWLPWTVAAIIAVATGLWGRKAMGRMCGISAMWLNYLIYVVIATGLFAFALLLANRLGAGGVRACAGRGDARIFRDPLSLQASVVPQIYPRRPLQSVLYRCLS